MTRGNLLHREFETLSAQDLRRHQNASWPEQWNYLRGCSTFYARKLGAAMRADVTLDGLRELPFTYKEELRQAQEAEPPFGTHRACAADQIARLHRTSGTTGRALFIANTVSDTGRISAAGGRAFYASGLRPGDLVVHCLNYALWTGGVTDHLSLEATGATVIPYGVGNSAQLLDLIPELAVTAISCTPSYPALLEQVLSERKDGRMPRELGLRLGLFGGEAGLDDPSFRNRLEQTWGFKVRNANYGLSEVLSILASQCEETSDLHFHAGDMIFAEIVDPTSGERLPIAEGTVGELVCTHLTKECQPLVRYRTGDILTVTRVDPCVCGRTTWRFRVTGRTDDMFNVRGVNVFPAAIREVINAFPNVTSGQFRIVLRGPGPYDLIELKVEATAELGQPEWPEGARQLETAIRERIGASAAVRLAPTGSLPRTEGKTSWIERCDQ